MNNHRLKDFEGKGISLTYKNKLSFKTVLHAKLTFVSKDSVVLMDCYQKEYIIKRERIIEFEPKKYGKLKGKSEVLPSYKQKITK